MADAEQKPHNYIQWKGTDVSMDFWCRCGAHCWVDGYFAYFVKCPHCETIYKLGEEVTATPVTPPLGVNPGAIQTMDPDPEREVGK